MIPRTAEKLSWPFIGAESCRAEIFRNGARMKFSTTRIPDEDMDAVREPARRGVVKDQSRISRHRCAFALGNSACSWLAMLVLTYHDLPASAADVKRHLTKFRKAWRSRFGEGIDCWIMEMQERGAPHFHLFIAAESTVGGLLLAAAEDGALEFADADTPRGQGRDRLLVRGATADWIARAWLDASGQADDADCRWWHLDRGIIELMDDPDAAGAYAAKEASKREQKELPNHYAEGLGRWWYLARRWAGQPLAEVEIDIQGAWPWDQPVKHVWDARAIGGAVTAMTVLPVAESLRDEAAARFRETSAPVNLPAEKRGTRFRPPALLSEHRAICQCGCRGWMTAARIDADWIEWRGDDCDYRLVVGDARMQIPLP